jgi:predicted transcriptional regulator
MLSNFQTNTLAERFVNAYNQLDHSLRTQYNFKTNISFSDLIRRCATLNQVIRAYEDDLIDLARLRNAIIHSRSEQVIAEPHEDIVALIEKVSRIISTPPLVADAIKSVNVSSISSESILKDYIILSSTRGHSNIPVYKREMLIGVMQRHTFLEILGRNLADGKVHSIDKYVNETTLETYLRDNNTTTHHFTIVSNNATIEQVIELFSNRKLSAVIITDDGTSGGKLLGIVTTADIVDLMQILEGY